MQSITRPDGNVAGLPTNDPSIYNKWLELLREAVPRLTRIATVATPFTSGVDLQESARVLGIQLFDIRVRSSLEAVRAIDAFAVEPNSGLIMLPPPPSVAIRDTVIELAVEHRLPAI